MSGLVGSKKNVAYHHPLAVGTGNQLDLSSKWALILTPWWYASPSPQDAELAEAALRQYGEAQKLRPKPPSEVGRCARCARREGRQNGCCVA